MQPTQPETPPDLYIYSPSGAVRTHCAARRAVRRLRAQGWTVAWDAATFATHQRFAGDDATRLAAITRAAHSGAKMTLIARGGYGLTRLLGDLPYAAMARSIEQGTRWVGYSDFTALQMGLLAWAQRTGAGTLPIMWAGPALVGDLGTQAAPDATMLAQFNDLMTGQHHAVQWPLPLAHDDGGPSPQPRTGHSGFFGQVEPEQPPCVQGPLWGGNLAVLSTLVGTPWLPRMDGGILFLEDVAEHPYRIERMLTQLLHAGILGAQRAVLLGQFSDYQLSAHDAGFDMPEVLRWLRSQLPTSCTVLGGLPFGHVPRKVLLPVGAQAQLDIQANKARLQWNISWPQRNKSHIFSQ